MRIGIGYDIHRLQVGERLVLGGVEFASPVGLVGHSDADVVLHAVADAILGAAALGDLGEHFPDTCEEWKDRDSSDILSASAQMALQRRQLVPHNVDVNVVLQTPKLGDRKRQMCRNIAAVLDMDPSMVSVKARTAEHVGPVGRGEAIEVQAVVSMRESGDDGEKGGG